MRIAVAVLSLTFPLSAIGCTSTTPRLDDAKSQTVLGRQSDVRVTAEILADRGSASSTVRVLCEVENLRPHPIEIALAQSDSSWDPDSQVYTVHVGSELPIDDPSRLIRLAPNERRQFQVSAPLLAARTGSQAKMRKLVRLKVHFLDRPLAALTELGSDLWDHWTEAKQTVVTNAIPIGGGWSPALTDASIRTTAR